MPEIDGGEAPAILRYQLAGCSMLVGGFEKPELLLFVSLLANCEKHGGSHNFAVIQEGKSLACSATAVQCLRDQGVAL